MVSLSTADFYSYLVELWFIVTGVVLCSECGVPMVAATDKERTAGVRYICKNKKINTNTGWLKMYPKRKSAMVNLWFSKSKFNLGMFFVL